MTWNPTTLRWEGNESVLRDFDNIPLSTSARPALITHFSGAAGFPSSSSLSTISPTTGASGSGLPMTHGHNANQGTIRIVGDMRFDPEKMCWVSLGEEEPDPFEGMADDEDEDAGGTIRASGRRLVAIGLSSSAGTDITESTGTGSLWDLGGGGAGAGSRMVSHATATSAASRGQDREVDWRRQSSASTSTAASYTTNDDLNDGFTMTVSITAELRKECREAEERHRRETRGWVAGSSLGRGDGRDREREKEGKRREERRLWEIRNLAMKS